LVFAVGFAEKSQDEVVCKGLKVHIMDTTGFDFVTSSDIEELFKSKSASVSGKAMSSLDMVRMEKKCLSNPFVVEANVYSTVDGHIRIDIWQRSPVLRVINYDNEHFYVDESGDFMPTTTEFTSRFPVVSGYIFDGPKQKNLRFSSQLPNDTITSPILKQAYEVAQLIIKDDFWNSQIEQIYVNANFDLELVPRVGSHTIILGSSENLKEKLNNLMIFYKEGAVRNGWQSYSTINLKYKGQVVCTKNPIVKSETKTKDL
jgi:cell division protein FtsQ